MDGLSMHAYVSTAVEAASNTVVAKAIDLVGLWCAMGDGEVTRGASTTRMENLSLETSRFSRDLLQRFMGSGSGKAELEVVAKEELEDDEGGIELNLGLSLGGRFGVDKNSIKLVRSSSIAACLPTVRDDDAVTPSPVAYSGLVRTSSLPVETEEEWRKRKELQTLRRMAAKRRRSEKRSSKVDKEGGGGGGSGGGGGGGGVGESTSLEDEKRDLFEMNAKDVLGKEQYLLAAKRFGLSVEPPQPLLTLAAIARQGSLGGGIDLARAKMRGLRHPMSQGSIESQGGSGSSTSELESRPSQGSGELSPASIQSLQEGSSRDVGSSGIRMRDILGKTSVPEMQNPMKGLEKERNKGRETGRNALDNMPPVFTKGDGPNGKRVDGILYKYGKGEEVRIMCVCHGSFLSPAEFIKHAGGTDVAHPLKHIVMNPNSSPFL